MAAQDAAFDKIMELVGTDGPFQFRFNMIYNAAMVIFGGMSFMNIILALNVPDHWCYVPGREHTNYTLHQWKHLTIPRDPSPGGANAFSKCKVYDVNLTTIQSWDYADWNSTKLHEKHSISDCEVREFDKTWYESTIVSQEDWVCNKDMYQTNTFALNRIGEVIGTFFMGHIGDRYGRKITFYVSVALIMIGRAANLFTPSYFLWFSIFSVIGSLCLIALFQAPYVIAIEISNTEDRTKVAIIQCMGWSIGICIMPFVYWYVRDWFTFLALTSFPMGLFVFIPTYMIESPRWLINRGRLGRAAYYLNRIAKINQKPVRVTEKMLRSMLPNEEPEKVYGMLSLFSGLRLAKNTIMLLVAWMISALAYFALILYIANADGNPFLNFFYQSLIEVPGFFIGSWMANTIGRRWTNVLSFLLSAIFCIPAILMVNYVEWEFWATWSVIIVKFWLSILFFAINLQSMETYPTCLRQTGLSVGTIAANVIGIFGPYIVYLGKNDKSIPIQIIMGLCAFGVFCGLFLPETLHQKLPDSMHEAREFGANQKFWSIPKAPKSKTEDKTIEEATPDEVERLRPVS